MSKDFQVAKSQSGYRVELYRSGKPYVTFIDGLSKEVAEQEARCLELMWQRIRVNVRSPEAAAPNPERTD